MKYKYSTIILFAMFWRATSAQFCGSDILNQHQLPAVLLKEKEINNFLYNRAIAITGNSIMVNPVFTIPVVFHIIHQNGPENIPDSIVSQAVNELNLRYQNASPYFDSTGHNVDIQFCLATVDPSGNPTTGITRDTSSLTYLHLVDDYQMKNINRWSPALYLNIWVVNDILDNGLAGYSNFPWNAGGGADGIVVEYPYLVNSHVLTHEAGHYCGLYHTFNGQCLNFNCMLDGDMVCDTPPDNTYIGYPCMDNACNADSVDTTGMSPFTTDVAELPNYMDYTSCPLSFSQGQSDRMYTLSNTYRSTLLQSNGCGSHPGGAVPVPGFSFLVSYCNDGSVSFSDSLSVNTLTSEWDFDNDGHYDLVDHNFTYVFPATGTYTVKQRVTGFGGMDSILQVINVHRGSTLNYPVISSQGITMDSLNYFSVCQGTPVSFSGDTAATFFLWSTGATTSSISFIADTSLDITLTIHDTTGFTWSSQCQVIHLTVHPYAVPVISVLDTIGYICQGNQTKLYVTNPVNNNYEWYKYTMGSGFASTGIFDSVYFDFPDVTYGNFYYAVFNPSGVCTAQSNSIYLQSQATLFNQGFTLNVNGYVLSPPVTYVANHQWFENGVAIPGATGFTYTVTHTGCYSLSVYNAPYVACAAVSDTVCFSFTGLNDSDGENKPFILPNPAHDFISISCPSAAENSIIFQIFNLYGQLVKNLSFKKAERIYIGDLVPAVYFIKMKYGEREYIGKLIVKRD